MRTDDIVIATELAVLSFEEPKVAKLTLYTVGGSAEFGINDSTAEDLIDMLQRFVGQKPR